MRLLASFLIAFAVAQAQRGYPRIETVFPGAVQRGTSAEVTLIGRYNLSESTQVLFDGAGIKGSIIEWQDLGNLRIPPAKRSAPEKESLRIKVEVDSKVVPGIYGFRILTKGSLSALAHLLITSGPCIKEAEPNNETSTAQAVEQGATINGHFDGDADLDVYRFTAKAGDRVAFRVHAARLQHPVPQLERDFSDAILTLVDAQGRELASADDSLTEDPEFAYAFQNGGTFYLQLREARYHSGRDKWWYALTITSAPVVTSVFPPVLQAGQEASVTVRGMNVDSDRKHSVRAPSGKADSFVTEVEGSRVSFGVTELPVSHEAPSPGLKTVSIPAGINGTVSADQEVDRYRFSAKAGERFDLEVQARRWKSALDPVVEVRDIAGRLLEVQDDMVNTVGQTIDGLAFPVNKDPRLEFVAPQDGDYEIRVRDANFFGSPNHFYFLAVRRQQPDFALVLDDDRMPAGPGESVTAIVTVDRRNGFHGPVSLTVRGLPEGMTAEESVIPAHLNQGNIVLTALPGAKPGASPFVVAGQAKVGAQDLERIAKPFAPMGQAGGRSFFAVPTAVAAVTEGSDIIMEAEPRAIALERGKSATVKIHIRRDRYSGPIEMNVILWNLMQRFSKLPAGLVFEEKQSKTSMGPGESEGYVTFRAEPDAPALDDYLLAVMGQITYNRIFMTRTAAPIRVSIR